MEGSLIPTRSKEFAEEVLFSADKKDSEKCFGYNLFESNDSRRRHTNKSPMDS